jgi:hypothetical protein
MVAENVSPSSSFIIVHISHTAAITDSDARIIKVFVRFNLYFLSAHRVVRVLIFECPHLVSTADTAQGQEGTYPDQDEF